MQIDALIRPFPSHVRASVTNHAKASRRPLMFALFFAVISFFSDAGGGLYGKTSDGHEVLYVVLLFFALRGVLKLGNTPRLNLLFSLGTLLLISLLAYCLFSAAWSEIPLVTLRRAALQFIVLAICMGTFSRTDVIQDDFVGLIAWPVCLVLMLSYLFLALLPGYAISTAGWRGVTLNKNTFGMLCAVALLCASYLFVVTRRIRWILVAVMAAVGLVQSGDMTSTLSMPLVLVVAGAGSLMSFVSGHRRYHAWVLGAFLLLFLCAYLAYASGSVPDYDVLISDVFKHIGRSESLTGRTRIWNAVLRNVHYHSPWLGGGYQGFWNGFDSPASYTTTHSMGYMGQAHDGYVDLYNDLGYVGLGMLMAVIVTYFCLLWRLKVLANPEFYFHFCLMLYILISNITESSLLRGMSFMNLLFYASYIRVSSLAARPGRLADPAGRPR